MLLRMNGEKNTRKPDNEDEKKEYIYICRAITPRCMAWLMVAATHRGEKREREKKTQQLTIANCRTNHER